MLPKSATKFCADGVGESYHPSFRENESLYQICKEGKRAYITIRKRFGSASHIKVDKWMLKAFKDLFGHQLVRGMPVHHY